MQENSKDEYSEKLKGEVIINYILEKGEDFDFFELAQKMEMTFRQLRVELQKLIKSQKLVVKNEIIKASIITESIYNNKRNIVQNQSKIDIIEDSTKYFPKNFSDKFKGYNLEGGSCQYLHMYLYPLSRSLFHNTVQV